MSTVVIPHAEWNEFLRAFSRRHAGWLVAIETHDFETNETVTTRFLPVESLSLDLEDRRNPRINVIVRDSEKEIKHVLFRPSEMILRLSGNGAEEGLRILSLNTLTTVHFRVARAPEVVDGAA